MYNILKTFDKLCKVCCKFVLDNTKSKKYHNITISNSYYLSSINKFSTLSYEIIDSKNSTQMIFIEDEDNYNNSMKNNIIGFEKNVKLFT